MPYINLTKTHPKQDVIINIDHIVEFHSDTSSGSIVVTTASSNSGAHYITVLEDLGTIMDSINQAEATRAK